jgi:hypothetical protein
MLKIRDLLVRSILTHSREISWGIESTTEDPLDYTFQIYRAEAEGGPFEPITTTFSDKYYFVDNVLPEDHRWRKLFYAIEVVRKSDSKEVWSDIASIGTPRNKYAIEISRVERVVFKEAAGVRVYVFPIKTFGMWCDCFDEVTKQRTKSRCLNCYNTNFVGGYLDAIETFVQVRQFDHKDDTEQPAVAQRNAVNIVVTNYPVVKPGDIIFQPDENLRWKISSVEPTRLGGALVHQNVTASLIDRDQVEYEIEITDFNVFRPNSPDMLMHPRTTL